MGSTEGIGRLHCVVLHCAFKDRGAKKTEVATRVAQTIENLIKVEFAVTPFQVRI
jgi:hypothetical protein